MPHNWFQRSFARAFGEAGVAIGGANPWDIRILDDRVFRRVAFGGAAGLGDAYLDGWWDCPAIDQLFERCIRADLSSRLRFCPAVVGAWARDRLINRQTRPRAGRKIRAHYDLGNDLFAAMLDRRMIYSCALWDDADTLDDAQEAKLDLLCRKLDLRPGLSLLDIGCGWGGLVRFAAERYGCRCVGITLSPEQASLARERCRGLPVEIRLQDYRDLPDRFDRIVSVGMFEHVGHKNYRAYMRALRRGLNPGGFCLLHTIATSRPGPSLRDSEVLWVERHIFPGLCIPSMGQIGGAVDGRFVLEDVENIGANYDPTLMAWHRNFVGAWPSLRPRYGERFFRMWTYYLLCAAGAFRARKYSVWQMVLSPAGIPGGYRRPALNGPPPRSMPAVLASHARAPIPSGPAATI